MFKAMFISPMIPSFDIEKTSEFFIKLLKFSQEFKSANYTILNKDGLTIHILPAGNVIGEMEFYMEVDNVDEVWNLMIHNVEGLNFKEPFDREYGMREIHIEIPCTKTLLFIGQTINTGKC